MDRIDEILAELDAMAEEAHWARIEHNLATMLNSQINMRKDLEMMNLRLERMEASLPLKEDFIYMPKEEEMPTAAVMDVMGTNSAVQVFEKIPEKECSSQVGFDTQLGISELPMFQKSAQKETPITSGSQHETIEIAFPGSGGIAARTAGGASKYLSNLTPCGLLFSSSPSSPHYVPLLEIEDRASINRHPDLDLAIDMAESGAEANLDLVDKKQQSFSRASSQPDGEAMSGEEIIAISDLVSSLPATTSIAFPLSQSRSYFLGLKLIAATNLSLPRQDLQIFAPMAAAIAISDRVAKRLGWGRLTRELTTLEAAAWRKLTVEGVVEPSRCNFSACAVDNLVVLFGGEGVNMQPMNDIFVLDLNASKPEWRHDKVSSLPPGRWGHALSCFNGSWLVVFGGYSRQGLLNDVFILDLDAKYPAWREVSGMAPPLPRSWHSSCTLDGIKLVVSDGCADSGVLLSDTFLLDLTMEKPVWPEITASWSPPSTMGHQVFEEMLQRCLIKEHPP